MKKLFIFLFLIVCMIATTVMAAGGDAETAYQDASKCYTDLKANPEAQKYREHWEACIGQFADIVKRHSRKQQSIDAKYSLGKLYEELAANSKNRADWLRAVKEYESFARQFSRNSMADDAYLRAASIHWGQFQDKASAKKDLLKVIKFYKTGDMAGAADKYLEAVEAGVVPPRPAENNAAAPKKKVEPSFVIVIDPGHGGTDAGAIGSHGTKEKDITLALSKKLAEQLKRRFNKIKVFLTRTGDATLTLDDRVKLANNKKADFFISIHANASTSKKSSGVQTYYLNNATDEAATRLARQENKNLGRSTSDLEKIIATMVQNASTAESLELAKTVHKNVVDGLSDRYGGVADKKVRSALFYVLVGVKCPSVLVETSFISNPKEEARLNSRDYQDAIAKAISTGLARHMELRKSITVNL